MPRKHARIVKHHRNSSVYVEGRYLHVDTKLSIRSKRGREIARETARAIFDEVGTGETAFALAQGNPLIQDPPKPPDSFSTEASAAAVGSAFGAGDDDVPPKQRGDGPSGY